jgi:ribose 5-phosphate isomerase RpiB
LSGDGILASIALAKISNIIAGKVHTQYLARMTKEVKIKKIKKRINKNKFLKENIFILNNILILEHILKSI